LAIGYRLFEAPRHAAAYFLLLFDGIAKLLAVGYRLMAIREALF
jgi:hypothetical protein